MGQAAAHLNEKRKERRVLHSHTHSERVPVCPVQMAEVLIIYEIFPLVLGYIFFLLFFPRLSVMESQNVGRKSFAISVLRRALIWFEISICRGPVGNSVVNR